MWLMGDGGATPSRVKAACVALAAMVALAVFVYIRLRAVPSDTTPVQAGASSRLGYGVTTIRSAHQTNSGTSVLSSQIRGRIHSIARDLNRNHDSICKWGSEINLVLSSLNTLAQAGESDTNTIRNGFEGLVRRFEELFRLVEDRRLVEGTRYNQVCRRFEDLSRGQSFHYDMHERHFQLHDRALSLQRSNQDISGQILSYLNRIASRLDDLETTSRVRNVNHRTGQSSRVRNNGDIRAYLVPLARPVRRSIRSRAPTPSNVSEQRQ